MVQRNGSGDGSVEAPAVESGGTVTKASGTGKRAGGKGQAANDDVGRMLRGVYRETVDEPIPDDLMDLLNKLE